MPHYRCCVGGCDNDNKYPDKIVKRSHVEGELKWHYMTKDPAKRVIWENNIGKGRKDFKATDHQVVCSNHFQFGKPTFSYPNPTLYLKVSDGTKKSPRKRRKIVKHSSVNNDQTSSQGTSGVNDYQTERPLASPCIKFEKLTRDSDVKLFTGLENAEVFQAVFEYLQPQAVTMVYWRGPKNTSVSLFKRHSIHGNRKLLLEEELFMVMQRLRLGLLTEYLAHTFSISTSQVSSILFTWFRLMSLELKPFIAWPDRFQIQRNLPDVFRRYYKKCRVIIDCTELFIETPSSLKAQALCWSEYKHHSTVKVLLGITPNGAFSYVSDAYGGRASDKCIVESSDFLQLLQPGDAVMADRGFKIEDLLAFYQCTLARPPSTQKNLQLNEIDVAKTSRVANARIYVEQAIRKLKEFQILKNELPISLLPVVNDIVKVCAALVNFQKPLVS